MVEFDRLTIEQIRELNARGMSITSISKVVKIPASVVEKIISDIYKTMSPYEEMMKTVDTYSTMIKDLSQLIYNAKEIKDNATLMDLLKKQMELQKDKVTLLEKAANRKSQDELSAQSGKQIDLSSYQKLIDEQKENEPPEPENEPKALNTETPLPTLSKAMLKEYIYKTLAIMRTMDINKDNVNEPMDGDTKKTIRKAVGCTKDEFKLCLRAIREGEIPKPVSSFENKLRKEWIE